MSPQNLYGTHIIWWETIEFQPVRVYWDVCVRELVTRITGKCHKSLHQKGWSSSNKTKISTKDHHYYQLKKAREKTTQI